MLVVALVCFYVFMKDGTQNQDRRKWMLLSWAFFMGAMVVLFIGARVWSDTYGQMLIVYSVSMLVYSTLCVLILAWVGFGRTQNESS